MTLNQTTTNMKRIKILVVEDSETSTILIKSLFEENEIYKVTTTSKGKEVIDLIKKQQPHIVLLDIMLPDIDGFSILQQIRTDKTIANTQIVIVSAKDRKEDIKHGLELGANDYVVKPIGINKLYERVENMVKENDF